MYVISLLRSLNPTIGILRAKAFCIHYEYLFTLLCILNVNMNALDVNSNDSVSHKEATSLLFALESIYLSMDPEKQTRVTRRVMMSGALPVARDTTSYAAIMAMLFGGTAGQLSYLNQISNVSTNLTIESVNNEDDGYDNEMQSIRAEAKQGQFNLIKQYSTKHSTSRLNDFAVQSDAKSSDEKSSDQIEERSLAPSASSYKIALAVAQAVEINDAKDSNENKYRLLGNLPALNNKSITDRKKDIQIALSLELPNEKIQKFEIKSRNHNKLTNEIDSEIPKEFLCAINNHVMKDPVYVPSTNLYFERSTIELWLTTRGSVCPITHKPLDKSMLVTADDIRNKIKRYHIQQTAMRSLNQPQDDLYDF
eukprot:CAMPEP_0196764344 /NCGR_PEP_ID=MMETSP1095-20130614/5900_1 /TAXON_ID=96789 ORGANISM="Chromulina nebulosa, Strain UTEXLB2642" /NCGR_SAMPLE_ID=MMETSP1095 /ASSEMBLY_ACC=CAM_ASM_000446 /LENGTH=365 /DNA_ID=CAMNT_0042119637 /DNA_START=1009 /DNA_END=2106 /DNA_ORIENTATION=+